MTTPETPGENPGMTESDSHSAPSGPSGGPRTHGGFDWRNRWILIGGIVAAVVAVVVIVAAVMLTAGGGSGETSVTLELIPDETESLFILNMAAIRTREADFPGDYDDFLDEILDEIESEVDTGEIDLNQYQGGMCILGRLTMTASTPRHLISPLGPNWVGIDSAV